MPRAANKKIAKAVQCYRGRTFNNLKRIPGKLLAERQKERIGKVCTKPFESAAKLSSEATKYEVIDGCSTVYYNAATAYDQVQSCI